MKPISRVRSSPLEPDSPLTSRETSSKFLDLPEPVPHLEDGNGNTAALPRAPLCLTEMAQARCLARSKYQQVMGSLSSFWSTRTHGSGNRGQGCEA